MAETARGQHAEHAIDFYEHQKRTQAARVARLLCRYGLSDKEIAYQTGLDIRQVKQIVSAYMVALRVTNRTQAALKLAGVLEPKGIMA